MLLFFAFENILAYQHFKVKAFHQLGLNRNIILKEDITMSLKHEY